MIRPSVFALLLLALFAGVYAGAANPAVRVNSRVVDAVSRVPIGDAIIDVCPRSRDDSSSSQACAADTRRAGAEDTRRR